jgi:hypothetical protein
MQSSSVKTTFGKVDFGSVDPTRRVRVLGQLKVMRAFPCELQGEVCNSEAHL